MKTIYALIWRANQPDAIFNQADFDVRIPDLMIWLRQLKANGHLLACGGGGFETHAGGLTLIEAINVNQAIEIAETQPLNDIGYTTVFVWDVFYAELTELFNIAKLV